jgi:hydroxymethylpyrimidine pyrophosphatase-like HAD family hydrolase
MLLIQNANKGYVVTRLSEMLRIPTQQIATIGDMPNDMAMFEKAGQHRDGAGAEEVRSAATYTTSSSEEEGFAKAVEEFVLNHAS